MMRTRTAPTHGSNRLDASTVVAAISPMQVPSWQQSAQCKHCRGSSALRRAHKHYPLGGDDSERGMVIGTHCRTGNTTGHTGGAALCSDLIAVSDSSIAVAAAAVSGMSLAHRVTTSAAICGVTHAPCISDSVANEDNRSRAPFKDNGQCTSSMKASSCRLERYAVAADGVVSRGFRV